MTADLGLSRLLTIQDLDRALDGLRHRRENLDEFAQLAALDQRDAALEAESSQARNERHELERTQKRLEDEVALIEDRITAEDAKLYSGEVQGVKELQALQDEITGLKGRQRVVEDQILEVMELAEPLDAQLATVAVRHQEIDAERSATNQRISEIQAEIDAEIADVETRRAEAAADVDPALLAEYDRIRATPGRIGVARLVGSTCHGCHLELPAVEVDRLKKLPADQIVHCDECGCILVR